MRELFDLLRQDIYTDAPEYRDRVRRLEFLLEQYEYPLLELLERLDEFFRENTPVHPGALTFGNDDTMAERVTKLRTEHP